MTQSILQLEEKENINNLLIQVHKSKFRDYISKGLICPDKFFGEEIEEDTQSKFKDFLLLSTGYIDTLDDEQLLLEIILTDSEKNELKEIKNSIYLLDRPLPITRVKTIYVSNKRIDSKDIQESLKNYNTGYISEKLFETFPKGKKKFIQYSFETINQYEIKDYSKEVLKYDKLIGLFASLKNINLYYTNENNIYQSYSDNYFSLFYNYDEKTIKVSKWIDDNFFNSKIDKLFIQRLNSIDYIDKEFLTEIIQKIEEIEIKKKFEILRDDPLAKKEVLEFFKNDKKSIYYYITLLFIYGKKGSNSKYAFKDNIISEIPYEKAENALALFGLYYGYSSLPAYEKIEVKDKEFQTIAKGNEFNIKFKLDSQLDYYLIESIYQYVFNDKKEAIQVDYLDDLFGKKIKANTIKLPTNLNFKRFYDIEKNKILDIETIKIKKLDWKELILKKLDSKNKRIDAKDKVFNYVYEYYNELIEYDISSMKKTIKLSFDKEKFLELVINENDIKKQNKLLKLLD